MSMLRSSSCQCCLVSYCEWLSIPLEEGGADKCNVVSHPIVWNLGPPDSGRIALPTMCERSRLWRALLPKGSATSLPEGLHCQCQVVLVSLIITVGYILQCAGILQDCARSWVPNSL